MSSEDSLDRPYSESSVRKAAGLSLSKSFCCCCMGQSLAAGNLLAPPPGAAPCHLKDFGIAAHSSGQPYHGRFA